MGSYYYELKRASRFIDDKIAEVIYTNGDELIVSTLVLKVTSTFEVGAGVVDKRIKLQLDARKDLRLVDGVLLSVGD